MGCKCVTCVNQETDKDNPNELFNEAALKHLTKPTPFKEETNNDSMPLCTNQSSIKFQTHQSSFELPKKEHIPKNLVKTMFSAISAVVKIVNKLIISHLF